MLPQSRQSLPVGAEFRTTHWSVILQARQGAGTESAAALEELCKTYWAPVYSFIRRKGHSETEAEDLAQSFFQRFLEKDYLESVRAEKGKFRSFLLACVQHFLANEWDRARSQKRGGQFTFISLHAEGEESHYQMEPVDRLTPEKLYERRWAQTVIQNVLAELRRQFDAAGKQNRFDQLKGFLVGGPDLPTYAAVAVDLGLTEQAVKSAIHRLREMFRDVFRAEIMKTVQDPSEVESEIRYLFTCLE